MAFGIFEKGIFFVYSDILIFLLAFKVVFQ